MKLPRLLVVTSLALASCGPSEKEKAQEVELQRLKQEIAEKDAAHLAERREERKMAELKESCEAVGKAMMSSDPETSGLAKSDLKKLHAENPGKHQQITDWTKAGLEAETKRLTQEVLSRSVKTLAPAEKAPIVKEDPRTVRSAYELSPAPTPSAPEQQRDLLADVPPQIASIIRAEAAKDYPNDYSMQVSRLEREAEAWAKINEYETKAYGAMPYKEKSSLIADAKRDYPRDFSMQVSRFERQAEAWETVTQWERGGIPGVPFSRRMEFINAARKDYPNDYSMIVSRVTREVEADTKLRAR